MGRVAPPPSSLYPAQLVVTGAAEEGVVLSRYYQGVENQDVVPWHCGPQSGRLGLA